MGSHLSSEHLAQLVPLLGSLARLVAEGSVLSERELHTLLLGVDLAANPAALSELRLWGTLLDDLQQTPDAIQRQATVEALLLRGVPEAPVLLAVATVADSGATLIPLPAEGMTVSPQTSTASTRLHASVTNLDFGSLTPYQTATLEFEVQGGPGHVVIENDHVQVAPMQFGVGTTHLRVGIKPLASGLLFTSLKLVTAGETLELPIMAQWQDGGAVPAQIVLDPMVVPPAPRIRQPPQPIVMPQHNEGPQPIVVPQPLHVSLAPPTAVAPASGPTPNTPPSRSAVRPIFSAMGLGLGVVLVVGVIGLVIVTLQGGFGGAPVSAPTAAAAAPTMDVPATEMTVAQVAAETTAAYQTALAEANQQLADAHGQVATAQAAAAQTATAQVATEQVAMEQAAMEQAAMEQAATATAAAEAVAQTATAQAAPPTALPAYVPGLVEVPADSFVMGSTDQQIADAGNESWMQSEKPQQMMDLSTYWIGATEVTNAQFRPFVEGDGYTNRAYWTDNGWAWRQATNRMQPGYWNDANWNGADYPVIGVTWYEAVAYCRWLSADTGMDFRLPTEAEWEKAARGTDGRIYPWGDTWEEGMANSEEAGMTKTTPVGAYSNAASPYGALDMAGNVWEWTSSSYKSYPAGSNVAQDDFTMGDGDVSIRGGAWYNNQTFVRCAARNWDPPDISDGSASDWGFRVVLSPQLP